MENSENVASRFIRAAKKRISKSFHSNQPSPEQPTTTQTSLSRYITDAVNDRLPTSENMPRSIDLGEFGKEAERLQALAKEHPEYSSANSFVCLGPNRKILLLNKPFRFVRGPGYFRTLDEYDKWLEEDLPKRGIKPLMEISKEEEDRPPIVTQIGRLFLSPDHKNARAASLQITDSLKILIVRTKNTTVLTEDEEFNAVMKTLFYPQVNPLWAPSNTLMYTLVGIANYGNLKVYTCPAQENIAKLAQ